MSRFLACCLCLLASPTLAEVITISDGQNLDRLNLTVERSLVMDGGSIDYIHSVAGKAEILGGRTSKILNAGQSVGFDNFTGVFDIMGSDNGAELTNIEINPWSSTTIHGYNFRVSGYGVDSYSLYDIKGWLLDGSFAELRVRRQGDAGSQHLIVQTEEPKFVDPDGDWDFDLSDLNTIRNNFGLRQATQKDGDTNFDGLVDLNDINVIRDHFGGYDQQGWPIEWEFSGEVPLNPGGQFPPNSVVPEPASFITAAVLGLGVLSVTLAPRRSRS